MLFVLGVLILVSIPGGLSCGDFAFLIDGASKSFQNDVELAVGLMSDIDVSPQGHHLSIVAYGAKPASFSRWPKFLFKHIQSTPQAISVLRRLRPQDGPSEAGLALEILVNEILPLRQSTTEVPLVVVHFSDGRFSVSDPLITIYSADLVHQPNLYVFSVSTGSDVDTNALATFSGGNRNRVIASGDVHSKVLNALRQFFRCDAAAQEEALRRKPRVNTISEAQTAKTTKTTRHPVTTRATTRVTTRAKTAATAKAPITKESLKNKFYFNSTTTTTPKPTTSTTTTTPKPFTGKPGCQSDIVVVMDLSLGTGVKRDAYVRMLVELINAMKIGPFDTQIALVRYSGPGRTETQFHMNKHSERQTMVEEIESIQPMGGTTRTGEALAFAIEEFSEKYSARPKAERSVIVFTDGYSQDDPTESAQTLQRKGIHVYAVAVEDDDVPPDMEQMLAIATDKQSFFFAKEFSHLKDKLARRNC